MKNILIKFNNYYFFFVILVVLIIFYFFLSTISFFNIKEINSKKILKYKTNEIIYKNNSFQDSKFFYTIYDSILINKQNSNKLDIYYVIKKSDKFYKIKTNIDVIDYNNQNKIIISTKILKFKLSGKYDLFIYSNINDKKYLINTNRVIKNRR